MDMGLQGRACVVTGAGRGIGAATARLLEAEGAQVLRVARSEGFQADVTEPGAAERIVDECVARFGRIDVLVNNAGTSSVTPAAELTEADWQAQWELNVLAPRRLMDVAAPRMGEGGRIVNVSSSSGKRTSLSNVAYSVTKAAELALSRAYAELWAPRGVLVNAVTPGATATSLWMGEGGMADQAAAGTGGSREDAVAAQAAKTLVGRLGEEDEIAAVIVVLCSALAANVAGAAWSVDGGTVPSFT